MIWLLIPAAYVAIGLWTWRACAMRQMEFAAQEEQERRERYSPSYSEESRGAYLASLGPLVSDFERSDALLGGVPAGFLWPFYWLVRLLVTVVRPGEWQPPTELARQQRRELDELRKLAKKHGLPMPGDQP